MARYGRDYGRDRWSGGGGYGQGGYGGGYGTGGGSSRGGEYGGMGSDAGFGGGSQSRGGYSGFGTGGGAYDNDYNNGGYGGYGYGGGGLSGGQNRGGYGGGGGGFSGGGYGGGQDQGGYGSDTGFSGGYSGGGEWGGGRDTQRGGGYGYGGGGYGGGAYGGAGYTGGGQGYGGYAGQNFGSWTGASDTGGGDELRRMRAADVMTDNPECVTPDTSLADAARKMRDLDVGIIPVVESESSKRLRGVLTDRDIAIRAVAEGKDANSTRVMEVMTTEVETCNKNDSLRDVMSVMEREQVRRVPITDREGRLVGIIAQADVATELDSPQGQRRFADTVESISEPGNPRGRGWGGRASQGRGLMGAVRTAVSNLGGGSSTSRMDASRGTPGGGTNTGGYNAGGTPSGGMSAGNNDPRAMNDPGSENV